MAVVSNVIRHAAAAATAHAPEFRHFAVHTQFIMLEPVAAMPIPAVAQNPA